MPSPESATEYFTPRSAQSTLPDDPRSVQSTQLPDEFERLLAVPTFDEERIPVIKRYR